MRFDRIALRGLGPFRDEVVVDLAGIDGRLVAITGVNGSGKSTLLRLLPGALYRALASKKKMAAFPLASFATERDAYVEVDVFAGKPWRIRQTADAVSGKGTSLVLDEDGAPVLERVKVREYDRWAAEHLPPPEVTYSSIFAVQGSDGFLGMLPGPRKAVVLRVLGIEHYERLAEEARRRAKTAREDLRVLDARIAEHRGADVAAAEEELAAARAKVASATAALEDARVHLETAREQEAAAAEQRRAAAELVRRRADLDGRMGRARGRRDDLEHRIKNNREQLIGRAGEIRAAVERDLGLAEEQSEHGATVARISAQVDAAHIEGAAGRGRMLEAQQALETAEGRVTRARARLLGRDDVDRAALEVEATRATLREVEETVQTIEARLAELRRTQLDGGARRVAGLRAFPEGILSGEAVCAEIVIEDAGHALRADDALRDEMAMGPRSIEQAERALATARQELRDRGTRLREQERLAARAGELAAAEEDERAGGRAVELAAHGVRSAESEAAAGRERVRELEAERVEAARRAADLRRARADLTALVRRGPKLAQADAAIAGYEAQLSEVGEEEGRLANELAELPRPASGEMVVDAERRAATARVAVTDAERELRGMSAAETVADQVLTNATVAAARRAELAGERAGVERSLADYTILAHDLGRDGLQALEIDAAGPELTELVNDLLHTCVGSRWTATIDTTRPSADGRREIEGLDVMVLDTEQGREAPAETYSGGELVLLGEAVSLALAMLGIRRSGLEGVTLVRDESGAALDPEKSRAWIAMIRRAADIVGASKVLIVSHNTEVAELCDARIVVANGTVEVQP